MAELHHVAGKVLGMQPMDPEAGGVVACDEACGECAAVYEIEGDGVGVEDGLQHMLDQDGEV